MAISVEAVLVILNIPFYLGTLYFAHRIFTCVGGFKAWILISLGWLLILFRKLLSLSNYFSTGSGLLSLEAEIVAFLVSVVFFFGVKELNGLFEAKAGSRHDA